MTVGDSGRTFVLDADAAGLVTRALQLWVDDLRTSLVEDCPKDIAELRLRLSLVDDLTDLAATFDPDIAP